MDVLFAVVARYSASVAYCRSSSGGLMVYETLAHARGAAKSWLRERRRRGYEHPETVRIVGISAEGDLGDIWDDYEHTEVRP